MKQLVGYKLVMEQILIILLYKQQIINFIDHQLNGVTNSAGWIFMNYRNDKENFDKNTILYGHVRLNYICLVLLEMLLNHLGIIIKIIIL